MRSGLLAALCLPVLLAIPIGAQEVFFEAPRVLEASGLNSRFAQIAGSPSASILAYQELTTVDGRGAISVVVRSSADGLRWSPPVVVASNVRYDGTSVPPVYSVAVSPSGEILVAVVDFRPAAAGAPATTVVRLFLSSADGASFREAHTIVGGDIRLATPRIFASSVGGWYLTMERFDQPSNRIVYSRSADGVSWDEPLALPVNVQETGTQSEVTHVAYDGRDLFVFVGENILPPAPPLGPDGLPAEPQIPSTPQLYALFTDDRGATWSAVDPEDGTTAEPLPGVPIDIPAEQVALERTIRHFFLRPMQEGLPAADVLVYGDLIARRPALALIDGRPLLAFEAGLTRQTETNRQIAVMQLDRDGNRDGRIELLTATTLRRTAPVRVGYNQPALTVVDGVPVVVAFTEPVRGGDVAVFARTTAGWQRVAESSVGVAGFPTAAAIAGRVHAVWHRRDSDDLQLPTRVVYLQPDVSADPPVVRGVNFDIGRRSASSTARIAWDPAPDASGIVGYRHVWTRNPEEPVPTEAPTPLREATFTADDDGEWYLRVRAVDRAGNWSEPATAVFFRDTTPPGRVSFVPPTLDEDGFLGSNTFTLRWLPPDDDLIGGYYADLVYIDSVTADPSPDELRVIEPRRANLLVEPELSRTNYDNGLWALTVSAVDSVGNVGEPAVLYVRMNKYVPVTIISTIAAVPDPLGRYNLDIIGRGFRENGVIRQLILDRDRRPPYDYVFAADSPGFRVSSDRAMAGPLLDNIQTGEYYIGLVHPERGLEFFPARLTIERNGTVKFGDYTIIRGPEFTIAPAPRIAFTSASIIAWAVATFMALMVLMSAMRLTAIAGEGRTLRIEARALIAAGPTVQAMRQERIDQMRKRGIGLRVKFAFFVAVLVMAVVAGLAIGLGSVTLENQRTVLLSGLESRVGVLLESMVSGAARPLEDPLENIDQLESLPRRVVAMREAMYATVASRSSRADLPPGVNYVWATNDPVIDPSGRPPEDVEALREAQGIDRTPVHPGAGIFLGQSRIEDPVSETLDTMQVIIDRLAGDRLADLVKERQLNIVEREELRRSIAEAERAGADATDLRVEERREELRFRSLGNQIESGLSEVVAFAIALIRYGQASSAGVYVVPESIEELHADVARARQQFPADLRIMSYPFFDPALFTEAQTDFLFYQPVVEPDTAGLPFSREALRALTPEDLVGLPFFRGAVRLGVATDLIVEQITSARRAIIWVTIWIALAALGAGIVGALILATIVVIPIQKLVRGVEHIRDEQDKENLKGFRIVLRRRDELFRLADVVNTMSYSLGVAAEADKELKATSDLQKKFIPLEEASDTKRKLTMAHVEVVNAEFHGYYEGTKAVSGDYFTFEALDGSNYAFIKCDVAGKGVEGAFIMAQVATMFQSQVTLWKAHPGRYSIVDLQKSINELLVEREFVGKFAAMTIGVINMDTGNLRLTHAGDNEQRIYRASTGIIEELKLNQSPAAGVFPDSLFSPDQEYREYRLSVGTGDIVLLATDGIEEACRYMLAPDLSRLVYDEKSSAAIADEAAGAPGMPTITWEQAGGYVKETFAEKDPKTPDEIKTRFVRIVEAAMLQRTYRLERFRSLDPSENLVFDYRGLEPTARNAVLAVMAAEKVFRLTPLQSTASRTTAGTEPVRVDRIIDGFLKDRFSEYGRYFSQPVPDDQRPDQGSKRQEEYIYYWGLHEEDQVDDLTFLAIRKK